MVTTIEIRMAPGTLRTHRAINSNIPKAKTRTGQPVSTPVAPSCTGTGVLAASGMRATKPASTKPINAMKRPIPTEMAVFSDVGTAWKTAVRKPVSTSTRMITPSITTSPIASAHDIWLAIANATNAFSPSPAARASG